MFCLPPPMAGFFEFSMMRVRGDVNQKALAELYYQYLNVEEDFVKALFVENGTPLGRIFVQEAALPQDGKLEIPIGWKFSTMNAPHISLTPQKKLASACATAAIKCSISGGRVMPQWTSA